jgi:hypothetical protein
MAQVETTKKTPKPLSEGKRGIFADTILEPGMFDTLWAFLLNDHLEEDCKAIIESAEDSSVDDVATEDSDTKSRKSETRKNKNKWKWNRKAVKERISNLPDSAYLTNAGGIVEEHDIDFPTITNAADDLEEWADIKLKHATNMAGSVEEAIIDLTEYGFQDAKENEPTQNIIGLSFDDEGPPETPKKSSPIHFDGVMPREVTLAEDRSVFSVFRDTVDIHLAEFAHSYSISTCLAIHKPPFRESVKQAKTLAIGGVRLLTTYFQPVRIRRFTVRKPPKARTKTPNKRHRRQKRPRPTGAAARLARIATGINQQKSRPKSSVMPYTCGMASHTQTFPQSATVVTNNSHCSTPLAAKSGVWSYFATTKFETDWYTWRGAPSLLLLSATKPSPTHVAPQKKPRLPQPAPPTSTRIRISWYGLHH